MWFKLKNFKFLNFSRKNSPSNKAKTTIGSLQPISGDNSPQNITQIVNIFPVAAELNQIQYGDFLKLFNNDVDKIKIDKKPSVLSDLHEAALGVCKKPDIKAELERLVRQKIDTDPTSRKSNLLSRAIVTVQWMTDDEHKFLAFVALITILIDKKVTNLKELETYLLHTYDNFFIKELDLIPHNLESLGCIRHKINPHRDILSIFKAHYPIEIFKNEEELIKFKQCDVFKKIENACVDFNMLILALQPLGLIIAEAYINSKLKKELVHVCL